ncbi:hypothetical protein D3C80_2226630 [compost metagenome]
MVGVSVSQASQAIFNRKQIGIYRMVDQVIHDPVIDGALLAGQGRQVTGKGLCKNVNLCAEVRHA